jgi:hypothetical protein
VVLLPGEVDEGDDVADPVGELAPGVLAGDRERQRDVLRTSSSGIRLNDWKTKPVRSRRSVVARVVGQAADRLALERDLAGRRPVEPAEQLEQRRLAGARRSHQRDELALGDAQRHAAQRVDGRRAEAVALREIACLQDRGGRGQGHGTASDPPSGAGHCRGVTAVASVQPTCRRGAMPTVGIGFDH